MMEIRKSTEKLLESAQNYLNSLNAITVNVAEIENGLRGLGFNIPFTHEIFEEEGDDGYRKFYSLSWEDQAKMGNMYFRIHLLIDSGCDADFEITEALKNKSWRKLEDGTLQFKRALIECPIDLKLVASKHLDGFLEEFTNFIKKSEQKVIQHVGKENLRKNTASRQVTILKNDPVEELDKKLEEKILKSK